MEETTLTQEQALSILIQGVRLAQKAGAFTLEDAEVIAKAIKVFTPKQDPASVAPEQTDSASAEQSK